MDSIDVEGRVAVLQKSIIQTHSSLGFPLHKYCLHLEYFYKRFRKEKWILKICEVDSLVWFSTRPMLRLLSSKAQERKDFWKPSINPVMLVFVGKLLLSTLRWEIPMCWGFSDFFRFFASFCILTNLATTSTKLNNTFSKTHFLVNSKIVVSFLQQAIHGCTCYG